MSVNSSKAVSLSQRVLSGQNAVPLTKSLSEFAGRDPRPLGCGNCSTFRRLSPAGSAPVQQACWGAGGCPPHLSAPPDSGPGIPRAHRGPPRKNSQRLPAGTPVYACCLYPIDYRETELSPGPGRVCFIWFLPSPHHPRSCSLKIYKLSSAPQSG